MELILYQKKKRNVEQYIYLSYLPEGNTVEDVFDSMKFLKWGDVDNIERTDDIKMKLVNNHKALYKSIQKNNINQERNKR